MNNSIAIGGTNQISSKNFWLFLFVTIALTFGIAIYYAIDTPKDLPIDIPTDIDWKKPPCNPDDLSNDWNEVTHPDMLNRSQRREFVYKNTDIKIAFEKGIPDGNGYEKNDHWHRYNPNSVNKRDLYLDQNGNPTGRGSDASHILTDCD